LVEADKSFESRVTPPHEFVTTPTVCLKRHERKVTQDRGMMSSVPKVEGWNGGSDSVAGQVTPRLGRVARGAWGRVPGVWLVSASPALTVRYRNLPYPKPTASGIRLAPLRSNLHTPTPKQLLLLMAYCFIIY
jgi:hypothetical protein